MRGSPTREVYADLPLPRVRRRGRGGGRTFFAVLLILLAALIYLALYLRHLSVSMALSEARDMATLRLGETVARLLAGEDRGFDWFVTLEKDGNGDVTAVTANTARINLLAAELSETLALESENGHFDLSIPLGDLLGAGMLQGLGPAIPVRIGMTSSSAVRYETEFAAAGVNQTRHSLSLTAEVEIDLLVPWGAAHTAITTRVPVAETVIVGRVPGTYITTENPDGSNE